MYQFNSTRVPTYGVVKVMIDNVGVEIPWEVTGMRIPSKEEAQGALHQQGRGHKLLTVTC